MNNENKIDNVSVEVSVRVGRVTLKVGQIKDLTEGSIIELDSTLEEGFELLAGDQLLGKGKVEEVDGKVIFTLTETV
ncbi:FliM/FliN family flagellar motor switch protein [Photobacterium galatheae]|uniref:Flagellar motor switch protein FliN-like C-terminal domain-containing protein n=1 Tax=Photobacterium galatheae TaxID=1654360 RepID=A0A066RKK2_9GAMM|nr:FliM/FliN family flagellar motor switch protein [Photobacterium galatheae]KDM90869.1 hypothetical protein EA58_14000 [Photobacterium galatheae]MCM0149163.1 FliM/FliN family flagellar motor switch protein [Photobacterium galatheae]